MANYRIFVNIQITINNRGDFETHHFNNIPTDGYDYTYGVLSGSNGLLYYIDKDDVKHIWPIHTIHKIRVSKIKNEEI